MLCVLSPSSFLIQFHRNPRTSKNYIITLFVDPAREYIAHPGLELEGPKAKFLSSATVFCRKICASNNLHFLCAVLCAACGARGRVNIIELREAVRELIVNRFCERVAITFSSETPK